MGCGEFLVKTILFISNFFFALAGLALLALGIFVQVKGTNVVSIGEFNITAAPVTTMIVGGIVFVIAFFGCCGAIRESNCMLVTYSIFMLLLMIAKIALAIVIFMYLDDILLEIPKSLNNLYNSNIGSFHEIETTFSCCGTIGGSIYGNNLPNSCCETAPCTINSAYPGCNGIVQNFFNTFGLIIGSIAIVVAAIELVAVVFGLCLSNHVRNKSRRTRY